MDIETLTPAGFDEWVDHCGNIFEVGPEYFRRHFVSDPYRCYESVFIIKENGQIVSTVRVFRREVYINKKIYKMGGIGEVSTKPAFRKRGYSGALLDRAAEYMKENGFDLSMLGTGYFSHYAKHGFRQIKSYWKSVRAGKDLKNNLTGEFYKEHIRPLSSDNFIEMSEIYDRYSSAMNCSLHRTMDYWNEWCKAEIKNPHGFYEGDKLLGYICFDGSHITELIASSGFVSDSLISIVPSEKEHLRIPECVDTFREISEYGYYDGTMVCLYKPVEGRHTTEEFVEYLNNNGGVCLWSHDGF